MPTIQHTEKLRTIAENFRLALITLFGSQATGKTHPGSDMDIAVLAEKELRPRELAEIASELAAALGVKEVDITDLHNAAPLLLANVARSSQLLYEKNPSGFARFRIYAMKRFMEARPLFLMRDALLVKRFKRI